MTDVFISYSRKDHSLAAKLAAFLKSRGLSTWWDERLEIGDKYRDELTEHIDQAKVVVVVWTSNSVDSDWVRAEAARARQQGKLVQMKISQLSQSAIPLPFGELNIEEISNESKLLSAIERLLTQPVPRSSPLQRAWWLLQSKLFAALSIVGGAVTLTGNFEQLFNFARVVKFIVDNWISVNRLLWKTVFLFQLEVSPHDALFATFTLIFLLNMIAFSKRSDLRNPRDPDIFYDKPLDRGLLFLLPPFLIIQSIQVVGLYQLSVGENNLMTSQFVPKDSLFLGISWYLVTVVFFGWILMKFLVRAAGFHKVSSNIDLFFRALLLVFLSFAAMFLLLSATILHAKLSVNAGIVIAYLAILLLPLGILIILKKRFKRRLVVAAFVKRLWLMLSGAGLIVCVSYVALWIENSAVIQRFISEFKAL